MSENLKNNVLQTALMCQNIIIWKTEAMWTGKKSCSEFLKENYCLCKQYRGKGLLQLYASD
jgi:hypothetical protein